MTGPLTNPKKLTLKKTWTSWLILWKHSPTFLFLIRPLGLFSGWGQVQKLFRDLPMYTLNLAFGIIAISFCYNSATFVTSFAIFGPFGTILWCFGTISWVFVLGVKLYLFVFDSTKFGAFFTPFGLFGAFFWVRVRLKHFLKPTYVHNQLSFWKYSFNILFLIGQHLRPLLPFFFGPLELFLGSVSAYKTFFGAYLF